MTHQRTAITVLTALTLALTACSTADDGDDRPLMQDFVRGGELVEGWTGPEAVQRARKRHDDSVRELPRAATRLSEGEAAIPTVLEN